MTDKLFHTVDLKQGTPEWLSFRRKGIGASEIPPILGVSGAYQTRDEVIREKLGLEKKVSPVLAKIFQEGHDIEERVRNQFNSMGYSFRPLVIQSVYNTDFFASLDGYDEGRKILLEVKSTSNMDIIKAVADGTAPEVYNYQIQWQLMVAQADQCILVVADKVELKDYVLPVYADPKLQKDIADQALGFQLEVNKARDDYNRFVMDSESFELEKVAKEIANLKAVLDRLEKRRNELAEGLLKKFNTFSLESDTLKISYMERAGSVDYKAIPELVGVDLEKYRKPSTGYIKVTPKAKGNSNDE